MEHLKIPEGYSSPLTIRETEVAIKEVKDHFERALAKSLHLTRVSAPLFVLPQSGMNDNLNGIERPVSFGIKEQDDACAEIVHSLAKWKRYALKKYGFHSGEGLYTDMTAIRRDEDTDNIHSLYVDQWDWEKIISKEERNMETLEYTVRKVYSALKDTEDYISRRYNYIEPLLLMIFSSSLHRNWKTCSLTALQKNENCVLQKQKAPYSSHRSEKCSLQAKSTTDVRRTMTTGS
jgi:aspartate--ammonia ligase